MLAWTYVCDGVGCSEKGTCEPLGIPPGWLVRTILDRVESLDDPSTGTGFPNGRSELQRIKHFCPACRRSKAQRA